MTPPITFAINMRKAVEALVWIIQRGNGGMDLYKAMKIMFAADKYHLNTYGCPIAGDRYVAMKYGTVPYWTYNAAKNPREEYGFNFVENKLHLTQEKKFDPDIFSESDLEALEHGFNEYANLSFDEVLRKNHEEPAWIVANARRAHGQKKTDILFEDMIEGKDWLIKDLQETGYLLAL